MSGGLVIDLGQPWQTDRQTKVVKTVRNSSSHVNRKAGFMLLCRGDFIAMQSTQSPTGMLGLNAKWRHGVFAVATPLLRRRSMNQVPQVVRYILCQCSSPNLNIAVCLATDFFFLPSSFLLSFTDLWQSYCRTAWQLLACLLIGSCHSYHNRSSQAQVSILVTGTPSRRSTDMILFVMFAPVMFEFLSHPTRVN